MSLKARSTQSSQSHWEKAKSSSLALVTTCSRENQKNVIRAKHCMCPYHSFIWHFSLSQTQNSKGKEQGWQFSSVTQSCLTLHDPIDYSSQASLPISNSLSLLKLMSIESIMLCNRLILCRLLLLLPSIFPSIRIFSNESSLHIRLSKNWGISPSNEYSGLISLRIDWFDSQESSPTPQFKSINSLALNFLYGLNFTSIHDYRKNHSFVDNKPLLAKWYHWFLICCLGSS